MLWGRGLPRVGPGVNSPAPCRGDHPVQWSPPLLPGQGGGRAQPALGCPAQCLVCSPGPAARLQGEPGWGNVGPMGQPMDTFLSPLPWCPGPQAEAHSKQDCPHLAVSHYLEGKQSCLPNPQERASILSQAMGAGKGVHGGRAVTSARVGTRQELWKPVLPGEQAPATILCRGN